MNIEISHEVVKKRLDLCRIVRANMRQLSIQGNKERRELMGKDFDVHVSIISKAVEKMANKEEINQEEVTELLKSLMNTAVSITMHFEEQLEDLVKELNDKIAKLETFLFRNK